MVIKKKPNERLNWEKERRRIICLYNQGTSLRKLGELLEVTHTTVCRHLDDWGIPRRNGDIFRHLNVDDLAGRRFGKLVVTGRDGVRYPIRWVVRCDCGNVRSYLRQVLRARRSCGCAPRRKRK